MYDKNTRTQICGNFLINLEASCLLSCQLEKVSETLNDGVFEVVQRFTIKITVETIVTGVLRNYELLESYSKKQDYMIYIKRHIKSIALCWTVGIKIVVLRMRGP